MTNVASNVPSTQALTPPVSSSLAKLSFSQIYKENKLRPMTLQVSVINVADENCSDEI